MEKEAQIQKAKEAAAQLRTAVPFTDRESGRVLHAELLKIVNSLAKTHNFRKIPTRKGRV